MTDWQAMKNIILPQTISIVLPPLTNQTLTLIKESAVLSTITVHELTMTGLMVQGETFRPFEVFIMVALLYWALNETIATIMRKLEKKFSKTCVSSSYSHQYSYYFLFCFSNFCIQSTNTFTLSIGSAL